VEVSEFDCLELNIDSFNISSPSAFLAIRFAFPFLTTPIASPKNDGIKSLTKLISF